MKNDIVFLSFLIDNLSPTCVYFIKPVTRVGKKRTGFACASVA